MICDLMCPTYYFDTNKFLQADSQWIPVKSAEHAHTYASRKPVKHVPSFKQGDELHGSKSTVTAKNKTSKLL